MSKQYTWINSDGLLVQSGTRTTENSTPAVFSNEDNTKTMVFEVDLPVIPLSGFVNNLPPSDYLADKLKGAKLPPNAVVTGASVRTLEAAASGGAADLILGTAYISETTGLYVQGDPDNILEAGASALADFSAVGEGVSVVKGSTGAGSLIGNATVGSVSGGLAAYVVASRVTAAYTAGKVKVTVEYVINA